MNYITSPKELYDKVAIDYRNDSVELNSSFFSFNVNMPKMEILRVYRELQSDINGDTVEIPREDPSLFENYTGDCESFLLSLNDKPGYSRFNDDEEVDFIV